MRILLVGFLALAPPAIGADFRGTEFGSSCAAIEEREKALGSEQFPVSVSNGSGYRFKGRVFDRDVWISYLCKDGALTLGDYHFPAGKYADAVSDYFAAYNAFSALYGKPVIAYARRDESAAQPAVPSVSDATRDEYNASWWSQDLPVRIGLSLIAHGDYATDNWHAMVVTAPAGE